MSAPTSLPEAAPDAPNDPGFGVYVHWPFCAQKCPYCDFNSHVRHGGWDEARFLRAYLAELDWTAELMAMVPGRLPSPLRGGVGGGGNDALYGSPPSPPLPHMGGGRQVSPPVTSIFFGGGTPSLMRPETVAAIIERIGKLWGIADSAEITLEANPGSVEAGRFRGYAAAGVNRVSLGLQSLRDDELKRLGRIHTVAEAKAAVAIAQAAFARTSFDMIYARPGQTVEAWRSELAEALAMSGRHLSLYQLTIEPETPFAALAERGKLSVPEGEAALALYEATQEMCEKAGLPAYEISNHASPGEESRHNLTYWRYGSYAGVGAGAHGRLMVSGERLATSTEKNPESWAALVEAQGSGVTAMTPLAPRESADEMLLMGLRLTEGVDLARLGEIGGVRPAAGQIDELQGLGLIERVGSSRIRATGEGRFVLNALVVHLSHSFEAIGGP
jgi:oxygen-independent coproporphyrinogen-3 oxidase